MQTYEHHMELAENKFCPFSFAASGNPNAGFEGMCNWHRNIEILIGVSGNGYVQCGRENYPFSARDIVVVNSEVLHRLRSDTGLRFYCMIIDDGFFEENGIDPRQYCFDVFFRDEETEKLCMAVKDCFAIYRQEKTPLNAAKLRLSVLNVVIDLCEKHTISATVPDARVSSEEYVKKVMRYINEHISEKITLDSLADLCGVTKYHLDREVKRCIGQTLFTYINTVRCKKAEQCIRQGMTVTQAAGECGFDSVSYFSKTYKKLMGYTPSGGRRFPGRDDAKKTV